MNRKQATLALAAILTVVSGPARAQFFGQSMHSGSTENIEGFTVAGKGSVSAKPNLVEIDLEVSAASELTADAIVKYRDAKRRLHEAFTALKLENIAVDERGLLLDQKGMQTPYYFGGFQQNNRAKTEVQLSRKLIVKATKIREMDEDRVLQLVAKLLDVAQDAGARVGKQPNFNYYYYDYNPQNSNGLIRFVLEDFDKLQEDAYEKAIADARARAQRLARLSGVALGPIVAIREINVPGDQNMNTEDQPLRKRLETSKFQEIPVRVELLVRFQVESHPNGQTQNGK
jgi:uncharacterized protein YggE